MGDSRGHRTVGSTRQALALGFRLATRMRKRDVRRNLALAVATAVGCLIIIVAVAASAVATAQKGRDSARRPVHGDATSQLRMADINQALDFAPAVRRTVLVLGNTAPLPPGLTQWPAPGEMAVSPALAARIASDPDIKAQYPWPIANTIGQEGLIAPDEYLSYLRLSPDQVPAPTSFGQPVAGFASRTVATDVPDSEQVIPYLAALLMLLPLGALIVVCARLNSHVRDQRIASLRLVGASRRVVATVTAVEIGVVALVGTLAGLVVYHLLRLVRRTWRIGPFSFFSADMHISPAIQLLLVAVICILAVVVAVAGTMGAAADPLAVRHRAKRTGWAVPVGMVGLGTAVMALVLLNCVHGLYPLLGAVAATVVGAAGIALVLGRLTGLLIARYASGGAVARVLAWRRQQGSGAVARLTGALVFLMVLAGSAAGALGSVAATAADSSTSNRHFAFTFFNVAYQPDTIDWLVTGSADLQVQRIGVDGFAQVNGDQTQAYLTSCRYLIATKMVTSCAEGQVYHTPGSPTTGGQYRFDGGTLAVPEPTEPLPLTDTGRAVFAGQLVLTNLDSAPRAITDQLDIFGTFLDTPAARHYLLAHTARHLPYAQAQGGFHISRGFDSQAATALGLLLAATAATLVAGTLAVIVADRAHQRRRQNNPLLAIGVPGRLLRRAEIVTVAAPALVGLLAAIPLTVLAVITLTSTGRGQLEWDRAIAALRYLPWVCLGYLLLTGLLVAVTAVGTRTRLDPGLLRQE